MRELICRGTDWLPVPPSLSFKAKHKFCSLIYTHTHVRVHTHKYTLMGNHAQKERTPHGEHSSMQLML